MLDFDPVIQAVDRVLTWRASCAPQAFASGTLDLGGGLGIAYDRTTRRRPSPVSSAALRERVGRLATSHLAGTWPVDGRETPAYCWLACSIGRRAAAKEFVIVDAAMNDLIRPALYDAHHEILPCDAAQSRPSLPTWSGRFAKAATSGAKDWTIQVVGPGANFPNLMQVFISGDGGVLLYVVPSDCSLNSSLPICIHISAHLPPPQSIWICFRQLHLGKAIYFCDFNVLRHSRIYLDIQLLLLFCNRRRTCA